MKITPNALTVNQLFSSANEQFVIPAYQRRYSWRERQVVELIEDIMLIEGADTHLLGSIVCLTGHHKVGINQLELVDGQQRLTTISIILSCLREQFMEDEVTDAAQDIGRLLVAKALGGKSLSKVALDTIDSEEFRQLSMPDRSDQEVDFTNKCLFEAFKIVRLWAAERSKQELLSFLYKMQNSALIIRLDVSDAKDAFKLFETINNRGLSLSATDIIKNFVLGNAARFGEKELSNARRSWALIIEHLDGTDTDAFFRYYLTSITKVRITRSKVVPEFKKIFMSEVVEAAKLPERHLYADEEEGFEGEEASDDTEVEELPLQDSPAEVKVSFKDFLKHIVTSAEVFGKLVLIKSGDKREDAHLRNLRMIKSAQTYGFLMYLKVEGIEEKKFIEVLKLTENFVLRRHICRERSNDTERLFAKLCGVNPQNPIQEVKAIYREACPSDEKFKDEFSNVSFTSNIIDRARYCLEQIEIAMHGKYAELKVLEADSVHVEHIIPQKIKTKKAKEEYGDWEEYLGAKANLLHPKMLSRIGNLTIFAGNLNISASNNPFDRKKAAYKHSSILMTKELATLGTFKFKQVAERSEALAEAAVKRWPAP